MMKRFLLDALYTLLMFTGVVAAVEPLFSRAENEYSLKQSLLTENPGQVKYLLMGNSLFANSFNPHELGDSALCVAVPSRSIDYDTEILRRHIDLLPNLQAVIIPMSGHLYARREQNDAYVKFCHARYFHIGSLIDRSAFLTGQMRLGNLTTKPECDSAGFDPVDRRWDGLCHPFVHPKTEETLKNQPYYAQCLREMNSLCSARGVGLIVVTPPATQIYEHHLSDTILAAMQEVIGSVDFGSLRYRCYYGDPQFKEDSLYADDLHLNLTGATLFARRVKNDFGL